MALRRARNSPSVFPSSGLFPVAPCHLKGSVGMDTFYEFFTVVTTRKSWKEGRRRGEGIALESIPRWGFSAAFVCCRAHSRELSLRAGSAFDTPVSAVYLVCICCSADYINSCVYKHLESVQKAALNGILKPASVLFLLIHL